MNHIEYSLLFFTILTQMSVGIAIVLWFHDIFPTKDNLKPLSLISLFSIALGMLVSLFHLGVPFEAYRAITHWYSSWLSREVLIFGLYFGLTTAYVYFWWKEDLERLRLARFFGGLIRKLNLKLIKQLIGLAVVVCGIIGIYFSANIYRIPTRPPWNSYCLIFTFFATALNLGMMSGLYYHRKMALACIIFGLFRLAVGIFQYIVYQGQFEGLSVFMALPTSSWIVLSAISITLASAIPIITGLLLSRYKRIQKNEVAFVAIWGAFVLVLLGEILNRAVFYMAGIHLPIG